MAINDSLGINATLGINDSPDTRGTFRRAMGRGLGRTLGRTVGRTLDVLLPPQCLRCAALVDTVGALCPTCWDAVVFLEPPFCQACGVPFAFDPGAGVLCGACIRDEPVYNRARAVVAYDAASRDFILGFKHGDRTDSAPAFGRWMVRAGGAL